MEIGQLVDFVIEYNRVHGIGEGEADPGKERSITRKATAADWDNMWG